MKFYIAYYHDSYRIKCEDLPSGNENFYKCVKMGGLLRGGSIMEDYLDLDQ